MILALNYLKMNEPNQDQLTVMRYADGELSAAEASVMEQRLAQDAGLRQELAAYQALEVIARDASPPEPADLEWRKLRTGLMHRSLGTLSWLLLGSSCLGYLVWVLGALLNWFEGPHPAIFLAGGIGLGLLTILVLRERVAVLPLDPYRKIQR